MGEVEGGSDDGGGLSLLISEFGKLNVSPDAPIGQFKGFGQLGKK